MSSIKLKVETKPMVLIFRVIAPIALLWFALTVQFPVKLKVLFDFTANTSLATKI